MGVSAPRATWRLWLGTQMFRAAHALQFFTVGIIRPEDFVTCSKRYYADPAHVALLARKNTDGLYPPEAALLNQVAPKPGSALVLGCGAGRESMALARQGWQVVGIDNVPGLIDAAKAAAAKAGLRIEFYCHDILHGIPVNRSFDLICLFNLFYSAIPTRAWRVQMLRACREHLPSNGYCLLNFLPSSPPSQQERWAQAWRKGFAWMTGGNRECQPGDFWSNGSFFLHRFSDLTEITDEAAAAGIRLEDQRDGIARDMAVLTPTTTAPRKAPEGMTVGMPSRSP